jgi:PPOX class probable F420-dependent enzyme
MSEAKDLSKQTEPVASRPDMSGYGIAGADGGKGLYAWRWATERLTNARTYWLATTRPDGRPHVMPLWAVWIGNTLYFSTGDGSRKARNLAANPHAVISVEQDNEAVIVEGAVERVKDVTILKQFAAAYSHKYEWDMAESTEPIYALHPAVAFGLSSNTGEFTRTATRWTFASVREVKNQ